MSREAKGKGKERKLPSVCMRGSRGTTDKVLSALFPCFTSKRISQNDESCMHKNGAKKKKICRLRRQIFFRGGGGHKAGARGGGPEIVPRGGGS